jgi:hypothetical protein
MNFAVAPFLLTEYHWEVSCTFDLVTFLLCYDVKVYKSPDERH